MNAAMPPDEIERLHNRIDETNKLLGEVRDAVNHVCTTLEHQQTGCSERMGSVWKEVTEVQQAVFGNSHEGLKDRVKGLETTVSSISVDRGKMAMGTGSISVKALVAILASVSALIGGVLGSLPAIVEAIK